FIYWSSAASKGQHTGNPRHPSEDQKSLIFLERTTTVDASVVLLQHVLFRSINPPEQKIKPFQVFLCTLWSFFFYGCIMAVSGGKIAQNFCPKILLSIFPGDGFVMR
ncbi:hypothetical protein ATANTOWER_004579, partial [Ataeniobius toweri]|nr:hypothetical protein [Ataeniobius toweri]